MTTSLSSRLNDLLNDRTSFDIGSSSHMSAVAGPSRLPDYGGSLPSLTSINSDMMADVVARVRGDAMDGHTGHAVSPMAGGSSASDPDVMMRLTRPMSHRALKDYYVDEAEETDFSRSDMMDMLMAPSKADELMAELDVRQERTVERLTTFRQMSGEEAAVELKSVMRELEEINAGRVECMRIYDEEAAKAEARLAKARADREAVEEQVRKAGWGDLISPYDRGDAQGFDLSGMDPDYAFALKLQQEEYEEIRRATLMTEAPHLAAGDEDDRPRLMEDQPHLNHPGVDSVTAEPDPNGSENVADGKGKGKAVDKGKGKAVDKGKGKAKAVDKGKGKGRATDGYSGGGRGLSTLAHLLMHTQRDAYAGFRLPEAGGHGVDGLSHQGGAGCSPAEETIGVDEDIDVANGEEFRAVADVNDGDVHDKKRKREVAEDDDEERRLNT
ncbi:hypothetical protein BV22DRAFT_1031713, partial [Leucogyrophana mollusca]